MKNLPEEKFWKDMGARLKQYQEDPGGDDWDKISGVLHSNNKPLSWMMRGAHVFTVAGLTAFLWLAFVVTLHDPVQESSVKNEEKTGASGTESVKDRESLTETHHSNANERHNPSAAGNANLERETGEYDRAAASDSTPRLSAVHDRMVSSDRVYDKVRRNSREYPVHTQHSSGNPVHRTDAVYDQRTVTTGKTDTSGDGSVPEAMDMVNPDTIGQEPSGVDNDLQRLVSLPLSTNPDSAAASMMVQDTVSFGNELKNKRGKELKDKTGKKMKRSKPVLYFSLAPSLAYYKMIPVKKDQTLVLSLDSPPVFSSDRFGVTIETGVQFMIGRKWEMYSGFSYYQQDQSISYGYGSPDVATVGGTSDELSYTLIPGSSVKSFHYRMRNAGASVGFLYHLKGDKLRHKAGGGILYQKGLRTAQDEESYDNSESQYVHYQLLYRFEYLFTRQFRMYIQPGFTHVILSRESQKEPVEIKPYRAGIGVGILYGF